jgi:hypothetical protein
MPVLNLLRGRFAICRLEPQESPPEWVKGDVFWSVTRNGDEISLVCPEEMLPAGVVSERGWCCLKVEGPLDFGQVGVLASLSTPLGQAKISIFVVSTYLTDYLFVKEQDSAAAVQALVRAGHKVFSERGEETQAGEVNA